MKLISKKNLVFIFLCLSIPAFAVISKLVKISYEYPSFKKSYEAESYIHFTMVHRKFKTLAEKFEGTVKSFRVSGQILGETLENPEVKFNVLDMDTDNGMRDKKMQKETLSAKNCPVITISFGKQLKLGSQTVTGNINILGNNKPIILPIQIQDDGNAYKATGKTTVLLSALGVPKPNFISDAIASVDDRVNLSYQVIILKTKL
jgi:polyisoprenoid-binding protein YceI